MMKRPCRFLLFGQDSYGLGYLRRTLSLVHGLSRRFPKAHFLSIVVSRFPKVFQPPANWDYVKLPSATEVPPTWW